MFKYSITLVSFIIVFAVNILAQEIDISSQLNDIANGKVAKVKKELSELKEKYPKDPSVFYLDALLTEDGKQAAAKYSVLADNYPKSRYADAALYRVYSYYYAIGAYRMADGYLQQLKDTYPKSEYIKMAEDIAAGKEPKGISPFPQKNAGDKPVQATRPVQVAKPAAQTDKPVQTTTQKSAAVKPAQSVNTASAKQNVVKAKQYKFTIQAGAFISLINARNLKKAFDDSGYFSEIKEKTIGGSVLNVVTVGQFATESEARAELSIINKDFNLEGRVVPAN